EAAARTIAEDQRRGEVAVISGSVEGDGTEVDGGGERPAARPRAQVFGGVREGNDTAGATGLGDRQASGIQAKAELLHQRHAPAGNAVAGAGRADQAAHGVPRCFSEGAPRGLQPKLVDGTLVDAVAVFDPAQRGELSGWEDGAP